MDRDAKAFVGSRKRNFAGLEIAIDENIYGKGVEYGEKLAATLVFSLPICR